MRSMSNLETGRGAEAQGGEEELPINDRFTERFLALFGDSPESRHAALILLQRTSELSQHGKVFDLLILSKPSYLTRRYSLLRFGSLLDSSDRLEVQVGRWGTEESGGRLDTHLIFPADYFDRVAVGEREIQNLVQADGTVVFTGSNSKMELDIFKDGIIGVRPKVRLDH